MSGARRFRFGVQCELAPSRAEWQAKARRVEALGFQTLLVPDHFGAQFAPALALLSAAEAASTLRVGTLVYDNDFRQPAVLAKEAATLDVLSGGRFELGIGAGCLRSEYEQAGIAFEPGRVRVDRLEEAIAALRALFRGTPAHVAGRHVTLAGLAGTPAPAQPGGPPLLVGGGGPRLLRLAGREADIAGLVPRSRADGAGLDLGDLGSAAFANKVRWTREGAGTRFDALELNTLVQVVATTDDRAAAASAIGASLSLPADVLLDSPYALIGAPAEIERQVQQRRDRFGLSYLVVFERDMESFAPIAARLAAR